MGQEPLDPLGNRSGSNPPSFIPSGERRRPRSGSPRPMEGPQAFQPRSHRTRSAQNASLHQPDAPRATAAPPSFSPSSSGRSAGHVAGDSGFHASRIRSDGGGAGRSLSAEERRSPRTGRTSTGSGRVWHRPRPKATTARRSVRRRVPVVIAALLAALLAAAFCVTGWVNGQLTHKQMLTSAANTPASTWLILGTDERDGTAGTGSSVDIPGSRTDSILVLTKPRSGNSSLISIPRDSLVNVRNQDMKINAVSTMAGYPALTGEVESITGMKIDHVVIVGFGGVEKVVDALGGVELCYDRTVNDVRSGMNWKAGCHTADGKTALAFSRMRYSDPTGDIGRAKRQRQVISAVAKKASSPSVLMNPATMKKLMEAGLSSLTVDEKTGAFDMVGMALAFRNATGADGVTGSVYYQNPDYYPPSGIGSTILLDGVRNTQLFDQLEAGTHDPGTVGGM